MEELKPGNGIKKDLDSIKSGVCIMAMGRPKTFEGPTTKVSVLLPEETARLMRVMAAEQGVSVAQLVDVWAHRARILEAVDRGRRAFAEGDVVSHEEAGARLKKRAR